MLLAMRPKAIGLAFGSTDRLEIQVCTQEPRGNLALSVCWATWPRLSFLVTWKVCKPGSVTVSDTSVCSSGPDPRHLKTHTPTYG